MPKAEQLADHFKVLSVEARVRILQLLKGRSLCVNALAAQLGVTPAAVSQHLRVLRSAGLVAAEKRGYFVHYRVNEKALESWRRETERFFQPETNEERKRPCVKARRSAKGRTS